jgi:hypothetical protein
VATVTDPVRGAPEGELYCPTCERSFTGDDRCPDDDTALVRLAAPADRLVGSVIDQRYTIQRRIGSGGMGSVYAAVQHSVGREVAVKVVNPTLVHDPAIIKRFLREAKLASRLSHPNAVSVLDFGQTSDGLFYLVMELIAGRTLARALEEEGPFSTARVVRVGGQILDALIGAHQLAIVHRDLKPSNVIVLDSPPGRDLIKVLDFGLAKSLSRDTATTSVTGSGALLGTPAYLPPEVATGGEADARSDLYSLGVILYQLASGRLPFVGETLQELLLKLSRATPPPLGGFGVPARLAEVIERLMAREPGDRYPSAEAAQAALERVEDGTSGAPIHRAASGAAAAAGADETLPATSASAAVASAPAGPAVATVASHRRRRGVLVALAAGTGLMVAGLSIAIALGLGGGDRPAPAAMPALDAGRVPAAGEPHESAPPAVAEPVLADAAPHETTASPPRREVRERRPVERRRERPARERAGHTDAGYPF